MQESSEVQQQFITFLYILYLFIYLHI